MAEITNCITCGKDLKKEVKGNSNKKYCSIKCKNDFNNPRRKKLNDEVDRINKILALNFQILEEILETAEKEGRSPTIKKEDMYRMRFSFDYYTQVENDYRYCYSLGYTKARNDKYMLIVRGFDHIVKKI